MMDPHSVILKPSFSNFVHLILVLHKQVPHVFFIVCKAAGVGVSRQHVMESQGVFQHRFRRMVAEGNQLQVRLCRHIMTIKVKCLEILQGNSSAQSMATANPICRQQLVVFLTQALPCTRCSAHVAPAVAQKDTTCFRQKVPNAIFNGQQLL